MKTSEFKKMLKKPDVTLSVTEDGTTSGFLRLQATSLRYLGTTPKRFRQEL